MKAWNNTNTSANCKTCGKLFFFSPSDKRKYCSRKCFVPYWVKNVSIAHIIRGTGLKEYTCKGCGKNFIAQRSSRRVYCSHKCSDKYTLITREKVLGSRNPLWNGGSSFLQIRPKSWRLAVFERDDYTCQKCGKRGVSLQADHIKPYWLFSELRMEVSNGQTLCKKCHEDKTKIDMWLRRKLYNEEMLKKVGYGGDLDV